jgi:hypothetical protein
MAAGAPVTTGHATRAARNIHDFFAGNERHLRHQKEASGYRPAAIARANARRMRISKKCRIDARKENGN